MHHSCPVLFFFSTSEVTFPSITFCPAYESAYKANVLSAYGLKMDEFRRNFTFPQNISGHTGKFLSCCFIVLNWNKTRVKQDSRENGEQLNKVFFNHFLLLIQWWPVNYCPLQVKQPGVPIHFVDYRDIRCASHALSWIMIDTSNLVFS